MTAGGLFGHSKLKSGVKIKKYRKMFFNLHCCSLIFREILVEITLQANRWHRLSDVSANFGQV